MLWLVVENYNYNSSCQGYPGLLVNIPKQVLALKYRSRGSASECLHEGKGDSERGYGTVTECVCYPKQLEIVTRPYYVTFISPGLSISGVAFTCCVIVFVISMSS